MVGEGKQSAPTVRPGDADLPRRRLSLSPNSRAAELLPLTPVAAVPIVFLHRMNQVHVTFGPIDVYSSDVAIAIVVGSAGLAGLWWGWAPLRRGQALWALAAALLSLLVASCFWTPLDQTGTHLITAAKYIEYALLAPAVVLLLRRRVDVDRLFLVFIGWSAVASAWAALQFVGLFNEFRGRNPDQREPSFIGIEELAALSGAVLVISLAGIALGDRRRRVVVAGIAGASGVALAASWLAFAGLILATVAIAVLAWRSGELNARRGLIAAAIVVIAGAGVYGLRAGDTSSFFSFLKTGKAGAPVSAGVQTGSQRVLLAYIGLRIWEGHPLLGVGFERSFDHYQPYLAAAKRQFPGQNPYAFPSPQHEWGVQDFWVQLLADLGIVGFVLAVLMFGTGLRLALRAPPAARLLDAIVFGWICVTLGSLNEIGIIAGLPIDALFWISLGLATAVGGLE